MLFHILPIYKPSYTATPVNRFFRSRSFWSISLIKVHSVTGAKQYVYVRLQYIQCGYNITKQRIFARRVAWVAAAAADGAAQFAAHGQQSCNGSILADCCASAAPHATRCRSAAAAIACGARAHAATAPQPQRSPAYNCRPRRRAAAKLVGLQFIARLRPIVLQFRGVSHSSYLAATDLNDLLSPFKVTVFFSRLLSKQTPVTCSRTRQCLDLLNWVLTRISFLTKRRSTCPSPIGPYLVQIGMSSYPNGSVRLGQDTCIVHRIQYDGSTDTLDTADRITTAATPTP